jgi:membrane-bound metal-dependent hydrolase YbcI (DUF457 family)
MAEFKTHLTGGIVTGVGASLIGLISFDLNIIQVFSVLVMGCLGGILPDLDSDSGKPLTLLFGTISVLLPALLLNKAVNSTSISPEFLVSYFVCCYFVINSLICELIKKITVHRGIMHSIPFAVLSGEISYLLFASSGDNIATIIGLSVFAGCLVHLIIDELNSVSLKFGFIPMLKKSSGTAFKIKSSSGWVNLLVYGLIVGTTTAIILA